ncbi:MAG: MobA/MobL family protein [Luteibacter sp.]|uniref:MobA/MobL family protein n=1 Tax=Luteibacter sp. TaxID=1886636 RepID=UPI002807A82B|nr:MobA/MobL family protein [Luteibacter sp.]MDQ7995207.1 MobA/MobL family protein [Luteibacter sp.]
MLHARPHLTTHNRGDGHSAVAGAAYRLGLRLYDRTNKKVFDFRRRKEGDEVVFQTTLAPDGAPEWASDPQELWNRVEAAEHRRDSQLARDYRVPLPLGLPTEDAIAMATEIARYIMTKLVTPVSVGVHRDSEIDAFGERKSPDQIGCHAHLYFATRAILLHGDATEDGNAKGTGMGKKLAFLSNKSTSGLFVDDLNAFWAAAANRYTDAKGLVADYDHRSYRKQGLKIKPQPRLGEGATALERQGIRTRRGDDVRATLAMSEVYRSVHAHGRSSVKANIAASQGLFAASDDAQQIRLTAAAAEDAGASVWISEPSKDRADASRGQPPHERSLTARFRELYFAGIEETQRPERTLVFRLVVAIEKALKGARYWVNRLHLIDEEVRQARTAKLDAEADLDDWQREVQERRPEPQVVAWQRAARALGHWVAGAPREVSPPPGPSDAEVEATLRTRIETRIKKVQDLEAQMPPVKREFSQERSKLRKALAELRTEHDDALPQLLAVLWAKEREWIETFIPEWLGPVDPHSASHAGEPDRDRRGGSGGRHQLPVVTFRPPKARL